MGTPEAVLTAEQQALVDEGAALFAAGEWWEAHERWERVWLRLAAPERAWLQAMILVAAALIKRDAGAARPMAALAARALAKLDGAPGRLFGLDLDAARAVARRLAATTID